MRSRKVEPSTPQHRNTPDKIWVGGKVAGVLRMEDKPQGWLNTREQVAWLWKILSSSFAYDSEVVVDVGKANQGMIQGNLSRQARQAVVKSQRAQEQGVGEDPSAMMEQEETLDAQRRLVKGNKVFVTAPVFLVYRNTVKDLKRSCALIANNFGTANVKREKSVAWAIWLESLPFTSSWLLNSSSPLSESRLYFDNEEIIGVLPTQKPRTLDKKGVEFVTTGGKPIKVDLIHNQVERALITGKSGSGKSLLAYKFLADAMSANYPVVGMDIAFGESTFKTATELMGDDGAYYDVSQCACNLLEPPDLSQFDSDEREQRLKSWKNFVCKALLAVVMGRVDDPALSQRCEGLITKIVNLFLDDPRVKERYNEAFKGGWKSGAWQRMPTIQTLLPFCSKGLLDLNDEDDLDKRALYQIRSQFKALLESELGSIIGRPSSFSPSPQFKFFALGGISGEYESYIMSLVAYSACLRTMLSAPKSLFVGDELSVLFKRSGFSELVGELCAVGRKQGIGVLLLSQDPDAIANSAAGEQIVQNLGYRITGAIASSAATSFVKHFRYEESDIAGNATEAYLPNKSEFCSYWLIEKAGRFWDSRYYVPPLMLAALANSPEESKARSAVLSTYGNTPLEQLKGLKVFADRY